MTGQQQEGVTHTFGRRGPSGLQTTSEEALDTSKSSSRFSSCGPGPGGCTSTLPVSAGVERVGATTQQQRSAVLKMFLLNRRPLSPSHLLRSHWLLPLSGGLMAFVERL